MAVITFPATLGLVKMTWQPQRMDLSFSSPFSSQSVQIEAPKWAVTLTSRPMRENVSGAWKALFMQLRGRTNQLELWDFGRPAPVGTMRGSMTLNAAAAQGATTLSIVAAGQAAKTLLQGDLLGIGSGLTQQVVMVVADATSNGAGVIAVTVEPPLRNAFAGGAIVTWDKPKALFRAARPLSAWEYGNSAIIASGFNLDLIEDWRA